MNDIVIKYIINHVNKQIKVRVSTRFLDFMQFFTDKYGSNDNS
jgi:hypothetical protein